MIRTLLLILGLGFIYSIDHNTKVVENKQDKNKKSNNNVVNIVAVGDNLIHNSVLKSGRINDTTYNFNRLFEVMKNDFQEADIAIINQETILGGKFRPYDGYPNFNSPFELGDAIRDAGFDVVLHASNHTLDIGVQGVNNCIDYWKQHQEIIFLGINESQEERDNIKIIEKNGIKFALLNYTYGLNGHILPKDKSYLVNLIDTTLIINDLHKAEQIADFTIVFPHWGDEYVYKPNKSQVQLAKLMTKHGADLIIGTHSHVLQSIEWIESDNGNKALCYYSLGNYTSGQLAAPRVLGGMAQIQIVNENDSIYIADAGIVPTITHYEWVKGTSMHKTYRFSEYTSKLERRHSLNYYDSTFSIKNLQQLADQIIGDWIID